ncbi:flagellum-specific ATP synthase FliI, partial [Rhizobium ruizarguesonis]
RMIGVYRQGADPDLDMAIKQVPIIYEFLKQSPGDRDSLDAFAYLAGALKAAAVMGNQGAPIQRRG